MSNKISAEFIISGHVQSVGYRWFAYQNAKDLGLNGFAKNEFDGSVTVVVEGDELDIQKLEHYLRQGPSHSFVEKLRANYGNYSGSFNDFNIR